MNNINVNAYDHVIKKNSNRVPNDFNPIDLQKNFLSLLIAQIKNQDPTDPVKNTELTTQLAQINTASGIEKLNKTVGNFSYDINQSTNLQVSSLIGHQVMIPGNQIIHTKDVETKFGIELIGKATSLEIHITDSNGKILHSIKKTEDNMHPGIYNFTWDGKDFNKKSVESGKYNILIKAKNQDKNVQANSLKQALVHSIILSHNNNDPIIDLGTSGNTILSNIREILP
ncbi:flagellar biosynthesis protein FlgD [Buchnera aphidicola (Diuraphis noxia)]|uniref:Basal-body rod modification protein FlgD n=1 Tax=Buchnera aphidicola subsp. Diuraphis noxia TaxID=118101 RepID=A0A1B2H8J4_BUCDN|nr:flagellar biosynthesis protein FlgD [Buchnera aphidicola (Diuraphis noxia)]